LSIEDNGCGIPEHQIEHLFEPFFTTKDQGKGTGLGLAMVYGAIKTHQGFIEVQSIEETGSTFHVYLPLQETKGVSVERPKLTDSTSGLGELILLADDDQHVRETTAEGIGNAGIQGIAGKERQGSY